MLLHHPYTPLSLPLPLLLDSVRFIANAAGGLLPVLAESLRSTFGAVILTSYGMTECMPISSPPQTYRLDPTGTSGIAVGPEIKIADVDQAVEGGGVKVMTTCCYEDYLTLYLSSIINRFFLLSI